jgi:catechol 2,3-dioxygenase-like lactoylglutathione lyase family enzyme
MSEVPTLRVARPTDNLDALVPFYRDGLGLEILYRFEDHDGFDGLMFGRLGAPYHFGLCCKDDRRRWEDGDKLGPISFMRRYRKER